MHRQRVPGGVEIRIQLECFFQALPGLGGFPALGVRHGQVVPRVVVGRVNLRDGLEVRGGLGKFVSVDEDDRQVVMGVGILRVGFNQLLEDRDRLVEIRILRGVQKGDAQVDLGDAEIRGLFRHLAEDGGGLHILVLRHLVHVADAAIVQADEFLHVDRGNLRGSPGLPHQHADCRADQHEGKDGQMVGTSLNGHGERLENGDESRSRHGDVIH